MKTALVKTLVIAAALTGAVRAHACIGWRISTNGWDNGMANGIVNGLDSGHELNPVLPVGTRAEVRNDPASPLPSLRELASHPLAR